ncbi:MAG: hypothetical protein LBD75_04450 [Candidatus Peribacteria bacterium]|jgi:GT2 family glycosyltransferase|nr:hypothetical protein [Candidatus Peribacteria bacterium]
MYKNRLEFILSNENANLRRDNWRDFIRQIYNKKENKQHRNAVLTCSYKNFENIKRILLTSSEEFKTVNMDYIVVISSVLQEEVSAFLSFLLDNNFKNVIVLEAITNLGGSGGVALGLEYILNGAYVKVILLEDDVEILDDDFFSQMFIAIDETTLVHSTCKNSKNAY